MGPGSIDECLGCVYEESDDIKIHLEYCSHCRRAYYDPDARELHEDKFTPLLRSCNCNTCVWLNITVKHQELLYKETRREVPHLCHYYDKRLVHQGTGADGEIHLYPCTSCRRDDFVNYIEKGDEPK